MPLSLALGTFLVIGLYLLANVAYLATLPFERNPECARAIASASRDGERNFSGRWRDNHGDRDHDLDIRLQ